MEAGLRFPDVVILVNNLGVYAPNRSKKSPMPDWASIIEQNFMSGVRLSRYYLRGCEPPIGPDHFHSPVNRP